MATYASTTNPFIEGAKTGPNPRQDAPAKTKSAPGQARLRSSLEKKKKKNSPKDDVAADIVHSSQAIVNDENNNNNNIIKFDDNEPHFNDSQSKSLPTQHDISNNDSNSIAPDDDGENLDDEIKKACENIVDEATRFVELKNEFEEIKINSDDSIPASASSSQQVTRKSFSIHESSIDTEDNDDDANEDKKMQIRAKKTESRHDDVVSWEQDSRRHQHIELIRKLRLQLRDLERYAYERGDLDLVPTSVLVERQTMIIDALKDKLSLNLDKETIESLELNELKNRVDKELNDLVDPMITKEHLLTQLRTQLSDLERYISHLHGTMSNQSGTKSSNKCSCHLHGCSSSLVSSKQQQQQQQYESSGDETLRDTNSDTNLIGNDTLSKTTRLIRTLVAQLMCSDMKIQECAKKEQSFGMVNSGDSNPCLPTNQQSIKDNDQCKPTPKAPLFHDSATWALHIDMVILATDSLVNLFTLEPKYLKANDKINDDSIVESVVRRQLVPAIRDVLAYGLIDSSSFPRSNSFSTFLFNPYYLLSSLTCFPSSQQSTTTNEQSIDAKFHVWNIIEDYYNSRIGPDFKQSSVKTLSQSFNLTASMNGSVKITSKQALLIAIDDIIDKLSRCKPNGPESHFRAFVYIALNQRKLSIWLRLVFKSKSVVRKYYHNFSFVSQLEKMDKFLITLEALSQIEFKLQTDMESIDHFISAF